MVPIFKNWKTTVERLEKFISDIYFVDANIMKFIKLEINKIIAVHHLIISTQPALSTKDSLNIFDDSVLKFNEIISCENKWENIDINTFTFGQTWSIHWFKIEFSVPNNWLEKRKNHIIELHWKSGCEVLLFSANGQIIKGLNATYNRTSVNIDEIQSQVNNYTVYVQASCSDLFGNGNNGLINPPIVNKNFKIEFVELQLLFKPAVVLYRDLKLLFQICQELKDTDRGYQALYAANRAINNVVDMQNDDISIKLEKAQQEINQFWASKNGTSQVNLHAMGHCHIDTAWLWRYGETRRKIARSWSTTLRLLEKYPQMTFVCSQAQQMEWLRLDYPDLFSNLQAMADRQQFIPVGGTWIEMDVNMPCSESLCRQFLYGQRFFKKYFGKYCNEFWLPDTFGYSPQLPQLMRLSRISRFMTQKLSWSLVNKFPNHTFLWSGLDGSKVLTHFPPGDSYNMNANVSEIIHSAVNFSEKGRSSDMMYIYGYGDGGQGPTEEMIHNLDRLADCEGLPRICHSTPDHFFSKVEDKNMGNLNTWTGELYLELHNGTYTTQRQLKLGNVHCEQMLKAVELLISILLCQPDDSCGDHDHDSMIAEIESQWKMVLLGQFHDVLPGSSIEMVNDDAYWSHRSVISWCSSAIRDLVSKLHIKSPFGINVTSWPLLIPIMSDKSTITGLHEIPPHSVEYLGNESVSPVPTIEYQYDRIRNLHQISNPHFKITVDNHCRIQKLQLISMPFLKNLLSEGLFANQLIMYHDVPMYWDAWDVADYHLETGTNIESIPSYKLLEDARLVQNENCLTITATFSLENTGTIIEQSIIVYGHLEYVQMCTKVIEWRENHHFIKVQIPTLVNTTEAQYRTQSGYHSRPTHRNTSWDSAKYEVCGHEWIHLGESNWGVSVLKEAIFGSSVFGGSIYLSLLRSPTSPDATADRKHLPHVFNYAIFPYSSAIQTDKLAITSRLATQFTWLCAWNTNNVNQLRNEETLDMTDNNKTRSFSIILTSPKNGEITVDWIKPSCNDPRQFVIRLCEQNGGRYLAKLSSYLPIHSVKIINILEEDLLVKEEEFSFSKNHIEIIILPFKIISMLVEFVL